MRRVPRGSVVILRAGTATGGFDAQGYPVIGADTSTISDGWRIAPRSSTESALNYGQAVVTGLTIYNLAQVSILSTDRVVVRGETWAVDGDPAAWHNGTVVNLKRAS